MGFEPSGFIYPPRTNQDSTSAIGQARDAVFHVLILRGGVVCLTSKKLESLKLKDSLLTSLDSCKTFTRKLEVRFVTLSKRN